MRFHISKALRDLVVLRASNRCEYCRIPQVLTNYEFHIEHVISIQHGGLTNQNNLAFCCAFCNWKKGTNLATVLGPEFELIPLFNPRKQRWFDHFFSENGFVYSLTEVGEGTLTLLEFNLPERVEVRSVLQEAGLYP